MVFNTCRTNLEVKHDLVQEEQEKYDAKMKEVHKVEEFGKKKEEYSEMKAPRHKDTFLERLQLHLIRNLEVSISNVHIAFEDTKTRPNHPFAFGIALNHFTLQTTNSRWASVTSIDEAPVIYKVGKLNRLSVYGNSNIKPRSDFSEENLLADLHAKITANDHTYILRPSNINAKLKLAAKHSLKHYTRPVLEANIDLNQIHLNINRDQYLNLLDVLELRDHVELQSKYIKYYQTIESNKPSLRRWKFAYTAIINEQVRPRLACYKWENIRLNMDRCREYHTLYFKELSGHASKDEKHRAQELEKQINMFNLLSIRRSAELEVRKKRAEEKQESWWERFHSWWSQNSDADSEETITVDEKKKLYDAIGYEDEHKSSDYPEGYIDIDLSIRLNLLEVHVWSSLNENSAMARVVLSDAAVQYQRRPSTSAFLMIIDIGAFGMYGGVLDLTDDQVFIEQRSVLIQHTHRSPLHAQELLHIEFETHPLDTHADYRIQAISQSLDLIYDAITINRLIECFHPGVHRNLKSVKKAAYSVYTDIKHQTQFLLNYHLRHIRALDINIDLQPIYVILPENGNYQSSRNSSAICLDSGHLTVQASVNQTEIDGEIFEDASDDVSISKDPSYIPIIVRLEQIRLIYAQSNEDWKNIPKTADTSMYLIKPMTFTLDILKCTCVNDTVLPLWKIGAQLSAVDSRLSKIRLFEMIKLIQSIPFPQSNEPSNGGEGIEELYMSEDTMPQENTRKTFETIENDQNKVDSTAQSIELEATFDIPRIDLHIEESLLEKSDDTQPFVRVSLLSISGQITMKTYDIHFNASLSDFLIIHEQFLSNNNEPLRLLSNESNQAFIAVKCLLSSSENPSFNSDPYNSIENRVQIHMSKPLILLQVEPLLSIARFRNEIIDKLSKQNKKTKRKSNPQDDVNKPQSVSTMSSYRIEVDLQQFRILIGTEFSQILDIQCQGLTIHATQLSTRTSIYLTIDDFYILDLLMNTRYPKIIAQQGHDEQILRLDISLYNYSKEVNCDANIHLTKMNIIFLYKYIDLILTIFNAFQTKTNVPSKKANTDSKTVQQFAEKNFKIHFDIVLNAPTIFIPINYHSSEGILIDLGQLALRTNSSDDSNQPSIEQQMFIFKNLYITRMNLNNDNQPIGDIVLLECAEFHTSIDRYPDPKARKTQPEISVKIEWDTVDLTMSKDDYACLMKIFQENFSEKIDHRSLPIIDREQMEDESTNQEISFFDDSARKQTNLSSDQKFEKLRLDFQIQKIGLTLFLDQSSLNAHRVIRNENSKFICMEIEMIQVHFQYLFDSSYHAEAQIQSFLLQDRRENVDWNAPMVNITVQFTPKTQKNTTNVRQVNAQLESFDLRLNPECFMALRDFLTTNEPLNRETHVQPSMVIRNDLPMPAKPTSMYHQLNQKSSDRSASVSIASSPERTPPAQVSSNIKSDLETKIDILIKPSQIYWLEDQRNSNANCLVLSFAFHTRVIIVNGETHMFGTVKDVSAHASNSRELKDSKIKYHILQPMMIDLVLITNSKEQKLNIRIGDIAIHVLPSTIRSIISMVNLISSLQVTSSDEKEQIDPKSLFDPKPFKDASFWFLEESEGNEKMIEQTDILEAATGIPSHRKPIVEEKHKQQKQTKNLRSQQLVLNLKFMEVKLGLPSGSITKPAIVLCLSNVCIDMKNWSSDLNISSRIQIELALFNDRLLAWEPLIEPIIDERGKVVSPWCIACSTTIKQNEHRNQYPVKRRSKENFKKTPRLSHLRNSPSSTEEESEERKTILNSKNKIHIQAEHLLCLTITKTSIELAQRVSAMFNEQTATNEENDDDDESMLSVHNLTGYQIVVDELTGIYPMKFVENQQSETTVHLEHDESVPMTVPSERLSATHLPAIAEQIAKRRQEFSVKIDRKSIKVDINQSCQRVYELGPSASPNWPIQILCDSLLHNNRRKIILSSIVKIFNGTNMPLIIWDIESVENKKYEIQSRLEVDGEYYLPIKFLYMYSTTHLFIGIDEQLHDFISFDWTNEITTDRVLKTTNNDEIHLVIYKELIEAYSGNTDEPIRSCFHVYIKLALHLINLLPIDVLCSIDNKDQVYLKPSELYLSTSGSKKSVLILIIPAYNNKKWFSNPVDLEMKGHGSHHEHIVQFNAVDTEETLRMILRVDTYRDSYRASLYSPFWIVNSTDLKVEFKIDNESITVDAVEHPFFICPRNFDSKAYKKKGHIRVYSIEQDDSVSEWSEGFSLHVIKSTGVTNCKVIHDRTYMVCVSIRTTSFGLSKIIILAPSMAMINNLNIEIEVIETLFGIELDDWKSIKPTEVIPFWPRDIKESAMCVRYAHNPAALSKFPMNNKHRTLLRMNDKDRPAVHVEVILTSFYAFYITFGDYQIGDASVLLVNCLNNQPVRYSQEEVEDKIYNQLLPPRHYVYYTWINPFKSRQLSISCYGGSTTIELNPISSHFEANEGKHVFYTVFHDGPQKILVIAESKSIIEAASNFSYEKSSSTELMSQYIEISLREVGISLINDITRDDLLYITINKSKEIWTETQLSLIKPLPRELNHQLEKNYRTHMRHLQGNSNEEKFERKRYHIDRHSNVSFNGSVGEIVDEDGHRTRVQRQVLDGLWIGYGWSMSNAVLHARINHIQIDNQLEYTMFPVVFHPIISKVAGTDIPGRPFIELGVCKTTVPRSKVVHFKYFKLLVQEFVFCADQGLIVSILAFVKPEKKTAPLDINMESDLKRIDKPLNTFIKHQVTNRSSEMKIYFDCIHLSPLKIHVSFSMHGTKPNDQLLVEYPLAEFLLQLLNIAEVQDVVLKLHFYERQTDRFTMKQLTSEILTHYEQQLMKQIHVVVLGLDVLGNPFGVVRGVAEGVKSFFYEPYEGAMEGSLEFIEGLASGTEHLVGSAIGGAAGAGAKITGVISKGLATLTFDEDYQNARIQRKELASPTKSDVLQSGKGLVKDVVYGVKGVVKKPIEGAKEGSRSGFIKGLGKGFLGLVARPTSAIADLTSTSFDAIKRTATQEEVVHRVRHPRHVGRDGIIRPSIAYEGRGYFIFNKLDMEKYTKSDDYIAHISCSDERPGWLLATLKNLMFVIEEPSTANVFEVEWHFHYKDLQGLPVIKFDPDRIEILFKKHRVIGRLKNNEGYSKTLTCRNTGEARYIVDKITETMHAMEL